MLTNIYLRRICNYAAAIFCHFLTYPSGILADDSARIELSPSGESSDLKVITQNISCRQMTFVASSEISVLGSSITIAITQQNSKPLLTPACISRFPIEALLKFSGRGYRYAGILTFLPDGTLGSSLIPTDGNLPASLKAIASKLFINGVRVAPNARSKESLSAPGKLFDSVRSTVDRLKMRQVQENQLGAQLNTSNSLSNITCEHAPNDDCTRESCSLSGSMKCTPNEGEDCSCSGDVKLVCFPPNTGNAGGACNKSCEPKCTFGLEEDKCRRLGLRDGVYSLPDLVARFKDCSQYMPTPPNRWGDYEACTVLLHEIAHLKDSSCKISDGCGEPKATEVTLELWLNAARRSCTNPVTPSEDCVGACYQYLAFLTYSNASGCICENITGAPPKPSRKDCIERCSNVLDQSPDIVPSEARRLCGGSWAIPEVKNAIPFLCETWIARKITEAPAPSPGG